jgi:hypothetical protein
MSSPVVTQRAAAPPVVPLGLRAPGSRGRGRVAVALAGPPLPLRRGVAAAKLLAQVLALAGTLATLVADGTAALWWALRGGEGS